MELTQEQYAKVENYLPKQRGNVKINNLQFLNAILYVAENGGKWRALRVRLPAYDIHAHEPSEQKRRSRQSFWSIARGGDYILFVMIVDSLVWTYPKSYQLTAKPGDAGVGTFVCESGQGKDVIYGFENNDILQITGTFAGSYNKSKNEIYFKVDPTTNAITLKDFTATKFNVNSSMYKISGSKLVK